MTGRCRYYVMGARVPYLLWRMVPFLHRWLEWRSAMNEPLPR